MQKLYDAENHIDAQLVMDELLAANIEVVMKGQFLSGAVGELPPSGIVTLWLKSDTDEDHARKIIADYEGRRRTSAPPQDCPSCGETIEGNFVCCWNCGSELPEITKSF